MVRRPPRPTEESGSKKGRHGARLTTARSKFGPTSTQAPGPSTSEAVRGRGQGPPQNNNTLVKVVRRGDGPPPSSSLPRDPPTFEDATAVTASTVATAEGEGGRGSAPRGRCEEKTGKRNERLAFAYHDSRTSLTSPSREPTREGLEWHNYGKTERVKRVKRVTCLTDRRTALFSSPL